MNYLSDKDLLEALSKGEKRAYEEIFRRFWQKVYHYIFVVIGKNHSQAAEDLSQNVFLKLWLRRDRLSGIRSLDAYLFTVSSNEARDYLRHLKVVGKFTDEIELSDEYIDRLDIGYDYELVAAAVRRCVDDMPEKRREVWLLSREEHLGTREIAARLGISPKTVERHISLALQDIRAALGHLVSGFILFFISNWV